MTVLFRMHFLLWIHRRWIRGIKSQRYYTSRFYNSFCGRYSIQAYFHRKYIYWDVSKKNKDMNTKLGTVTQLTKFHDQLYPRNFIFFFFSKLPIKLLTRNFSIFAYIVILRYFTLYRSILQYTYYWILLYSLLTFC